MTLLQWIFCSLICLISAKKKPNILVILADDLGYNDVSWHNPDMITPNLQKLVDNAITLENHYVQPICTPTRSALLTGYYPIHTGRQHDVFWPQEPKGLLTNFTLMPEYFKELGYKTHAVGKWHLGFCNASYLPTERGFDTFHGYYTGAEEYYTHTRGATIGGGPPGYDFRNGNEVDLGANGTYSSFLIADRTTRIIENHVKTNFEDPLFMYLPFQNVHSPLQVPKNYSDLYPHLKNAYRKTYCGMVTALDEAIGQVISSLKKNGLYKNTIIVFSADNGGQVMAGGNNFPLRGNKNTLWEGGTRSSAFIHAPFILKGRREVSKMLIHVTDWLPTLLSAAGSTTKLNGIDGINQWSALLHNYKTGPRKEMLYNIDPGKAGTNLINAGIRHKEMKLLVGDPGKPDGWIPPPKVMNLSAEQIKDLQSHFFAFEESVRLFNLTNDPYEKENLALTYPSIVADLKARLSKYFKTMIKPDIADEVQAGNPNNFGGFFTTGWCKAGLL